MKGKVYRNSKGQYHREDGPAIEYALGDKVWFINGQRHRTDGPAVEYADGDKYWYLNDKQLTEELFNCKLYRILYVSSIC